MKDLKKIDILAKGKEKGQDLAEYALLVGLIALVIILAVTIMGQSFSGLFSTLASDVGNWF